MNESESPKATKRKDAVIKLFVWGIGIVMIVAGWFITPHNTSFFHEVDLNGKVTVNHVDLVNIRADIENNGDQSAQGFDVQIQVKRDTDTVFGEDLCLASTFSNGTCLPAMAQSSGLRRSLKSGYRYSDCITLKVWSDPR